MATSKSHKRLVKARISLILSQPFYGQLALRMVLKEAPWCKTAATDGKHFFYSPAYIDRLTDAQLKGLFCHEVLHCSNGHIWRRGGRDPKLWNIACDYAIDPIIAASKLDVPDPTIDPAFTGKSAEAIFADLKRKQQPEQSQGQGQGDPQPGGETDDSQPQSGSGDGQADQDPPQQDADEEEDQDPSQPGDGDEEGDEDTQDGSRPSQPSQGKDAKPKSDPREPDYAPTKGEVIDGPSESALEDEANWKVATIQAANAARAQGKLPAHLEQFVEQVTEQKVDWRAALRRYVQQLAALDYTWRMPSPRYAAGGLYLPKLQSEQLPPIVVVFDTSGSCWNDQETFFSELRAIIDECAPERVYFLQCDAAVDKVEELLPGDPIQPDVRGGGGTSFCPAFEWVEQQAIQPACLIYLTDLYGNAPEEAPEYPVLWANVTKNVPDRYVPGFGEVLYIGD